MIERSELSFGQSLPSEVIYEADLPVSAGEGKLSMDWLLIQCRQGHPARRVGVMTVVADGINSSALTKETIVLG